MQEDNRHSETYRHISFHSSNSQYTYQFREVPSSASFLYTLNKFTSTYIINTHTYMHGRMQAHTYVGAYTLTSTGDRVCIHTTLCGSQKDTGVLP